MAYHLVTIQHDVTADRYHPTYYTLARFPGGMDMPARRYKSRGHHTEGFAELTEAVNSAHELARELDCDEDKFEIREVESAGADIAFRRPVDA